MIRQKLEYACAVREPQWKIHIENLEKVRKGIRLWTLYKGIWHATLQSRSFRMIQIEREKTPDKINVISKSYIKFNWYPYWSFGHLTQTD